MKGHERMKVYEYKISIDTGDFMLNEYDVEHIKGAYGKYCVLFCTSGDLKTINAVYLISITCLYKLSPIKLEKVKSYQVKLFTQFKESLKFPEP
jgi:hypothetical protein